MTQKYVPVIGLEVHVELNTKSKMFSGSSADYFGKEPNTHTDPTNLGLPGALPYINQQAIDDCIKIGLALNCSISPISRFERKNYFYPDLPKGYQISQYRWPLCVGGFMEVEDKDGNITKIRINRVHQEEDTGKLMHADGQTLIDYNRSGVPLVEIVTEPDFHDSSSVRDFAKKLQQIFRYLGVSNADMERGDMRLEANVSVRPEGTEGLPNYRIELKNINSFRFMVAAIEYEIKRQSEALERGEKLTQETRGWNENKKETYLQRSKEEAHDYRYFPEPDLPEIRVKESKSQRVRESLPELPEAKIKRFMTDYGISKAAAEVLTDTIEMANFFEEAVKDGENENIGALEVANYIVNKKVDIDETRPEEVVEEIASRKFGIVEDETEIEKVVEEVMSENPKSVEDYRKGKLNAIQVLIGGVMRKTQGKASAELVKKILGEKLS